MSALSSQSIRRLCTPIFRGGPVMIEPFVDHKVVVNGKSYGLSASSYDVRSGKTFILWPKCFKCVPMLEIVDMPDNVQATVRDKSTYARLGMSVFNTHIDPGFRGGVTIELSNKRWFRPIFVRSGDPLCQLAFEWLDFPTEYPYVGKYQGQVAGQGAIHESGRKPERRTWAGKGLHVLRTCKRAVGRVARLPGRGR